MQSSSNKGQHYPIDLIRIFLYRASILCEGVSDNLINDHEIFLVFKNKI